MLSTFLKLLINRIFHVLIFNFIQHDMFRIMQITAVSVQSSPSTDQSLPYFRHQNFAVQMKRVEALPFLAKGVVESFWVLFSAKKYLPLPGMRAGKPVLKRLR
jgi:hypothetical protein